MQPQQQSVRQSPAKYSQIVSKQAIQSDAKHTGCIERLTVMAAELDRMADALRQQQLYIQELQSNQPQDLSQQVAQLSLQLEAQKKRYDQFRELKEQQIEELENDNNRVHKELKEVKLEKMEYVNRYSQQCEEVVRVQKELDRVKNTKTEYTQLTHQLQQLQEENSMLKAQLLGSSKYDSKVPLQTNGSTSSTTRQVVTTTQSSRGAPEVRSQVTRTVDGKTETFEYSGSADNEYSDFQNKFGKNQRESTFKRDSMGQRELGAYKEVRESNYQSNVAKDPQYARDSSYRESTFQREAAQRQPTNFKDQQSYKSPVIPNVQDGNYGQKTLTEYRTSTVTQSKFPKPQY